MRRMFKLIALLIFSVFSSFVSQSAIAEPAPPPEIERYAQGVWEGCKELMPDRVQNDPLAGVQAVDIDSDGVLEFMADNLNICGDHMAGANCTNRGCDLVIWQFRRGAWTQVFNEHLHSKFISVDRNTRRLQRITASIYAGDERCKSPKHRDYDSGESCDVVVTYARGRWKWTPIR
jgi:hypothetical protein